jgi:hypothetical protein
LLSGVFVCIFAPLALTADVLALRGLRLWKRSLLLPWLVLYAVIILLVNKFKTDFSREDILNHLIIH